MNRTAAVFGPLLCAVGIALGAFGTHALSDVISPERLQTWQTSARYLIYQGLGLLIIASLTWQLNNLMTRAVLMLLSGALIFSVSLILLVLTNTPVLGAITPIGGVLMILGWLDVSLTLYNSTQPETKT